MLLSQAESRWPDWLRTRLGATGGAPSVRPSWPTAVTALLSGMPVCLDQRPNLGGGPHADGREAGDEVDDWVGVVALEEIESA